MNRTKWIVAAVVCGCAIGAATAIITLRIAAHSAPVQAKVVDNQVVYPPVLQGTKSLELGELVLLMMPVSDAEQIGWDYRVDAPIAWQTNGYAELPGGITYIRQGFARVNIQGAKATVLRQKVTELGWAVTYSTHQPPKFGPHEIDIRPGGDGDDTCFGTNFTGCDFDEPLASLVAAGIHVKTLCTKQSGANKISAFLIAHPNRKPSVLVWETSGGSGARVLG